MGVTFYKFHWTEWYDQKIVDQGNSIYHTQNPPFTLNELKNTVKTLYNKDFTALITIEAPTEISLEIFEALTGKPYFI